jgi:transposase
VRTVSKGAEDVTTSEAQAPDGVVEAVLGVDTHLDFHVAVVLDRLGRRLGELAVPTTARGYEKLIQWAQGFGLVKCAGV